MYLFRNLIPLEQEPQGHPDGIFPYLVKGTNMGVVIPEIVKLKPVKASFNVKVPGRK